MDETVSCPYNSSHKISKSKFHIHITNHCKDKMKKEHLFKNCPYDFCHVIRIELYEDHLNKCASKPSNNIESGLMAELAAAAKQQKQENNKKKQELGDKFEEKSKLNNILYGPEGDLVTRSEFKEKFVDDLDWESTFRSIVKSYHNPNSKENAEKEGLEQKIDKFANDISAIDMNESQVEEERYREESKIMNDSKINQSDQNHPQSIIDSLDKSINATNNTISSINQSNIFDDSILTEYNSTLKKKRNGKKYQN